MPSAADMTQPKPLAMPADTGSRDGYIPDRNRMD